MPGRVLVQFVVPPVNRRERLLRMADRALRIPGPGLLALRPRTTVLRAPLDLEPPLLQPQVPLVVRQRVERAERQSEGSCDVEVSADICRTSEESPAFGSDATPAFSQTAAE